MKDSQSKVHSLNAVEAFTFYEAVRHRLPEATYPAASREMKDILAVAEHCDVFVFDAYGVLNVGSTPVAGAKEQIDALRALDKKVFVLTNGSSLNRFDTAMKFSNLGYEFGDSEIVSSRLAAELALRDSHAGVKGRWGIIARDDFSPADLPVECKLLADDPRDYTESAAFLFLGASSWTEKRQVLLTDSLAENPRHLLIANPDVVAPFPGGFSIEPGYYGHRIADALNLNVEFFGKPFGSVFDLVERSCPGVSKERFCMVGDTLHTDILGGRARGWQTTLVTGHGLFRGMQVSDFVRHSNIVPDWIVHSI